MTRMKEYLSQSVVTEREDVVLEMTGDVNKVFGESNTDNVAREDEIENYLYEGEVSIDFNDIDETMYEYGENEHKHK
ncbi:170_t:CDS:2 [Paraglomus brasilianum]|uniref:170_t:CDS:1 n=1 Tax=Paraglomus brasilianum TaxID=144538 RepID=A0A9N9F2P0_9GLOM|nr:170_t:CDS:2 [Paraglomus brasilianum]